MSRQQQAGIKAAHDTYLVTIQDSVSSTILTNEKHHVVKHVLIECLVFEQLFTLTIIYCLVFF